MDVNICKIQKSTTFIHFIPKIFRISPSKTVQIYTFAIVTMHICMATVACVYHILLISRFALFFFSHPSVPLFANRDSKEEEHKPPTIINSAPPNKIGRAHV